jgi:hypothetical protein
LNCLELPADIEVVTKTFEGKQWSKNRKNLE